MRKVFLICVALMSVLLFVVQMQSVAIAGCCIVEDEDVYPKVIQIGPTPFDFDFRASCEDVVRCLLESDLIDCELKPDCQTPSNYVDGTARATPCDRDCSVHVIRRHYIQADSSDACPGKYVDYQGASDLPVCEVDFIGFSSVDVTWLNQAQLLDCLACVVCMMQPVYQMLEDVDPIIRDCLGEQLDDAGKDNGPGGPGGTWHSLPLGVCPHLP